MRRTSKLLLGGVLGAAALAAVPAEPALGVTVCGHSHIGHVDTWPLAECGGCGTGVGPNTGFEPWLWVRVCVIP